MEQVVSLSGEMMEAIDISVKKAVQAALVIGQLQAAKTVDDAYKDTEKRLHAYPILLAKLDDDKEQLQELTTHGARERSKSLVRFTRTTTRLSPDEILAALIQDLTATIAADQYEADTIAGALQTIEHDPYYAVIAGRFIDKQTDEDIAEQIHCDPSTVRRNRGRLIRALAVRLYGVKAL